MLIRAVDCIDWVAVGNRIRERRMAMSYVNEDGEVCDKVNQEVFAMACRNEDCPEVSKQYISKIEKGNQKNPSFYVMRNIAKALGVSFHWLLGDEISPAIAPAVESEDELSRSTLDVSDLSLQSRVHLLAIRNVFRELDSDGDFNTMLRSLLR